MSLLVRPRVKYYHSISLFLIFLIQLKPTGLVDAETEEEFLAQLESFKDVWNAREKQHLSASQSPKFHDYISNKVMIMTDARLLF